MKIFENKLKSFLKFKKNEIKGANWDSFPSEFSVIDKHKNPRINSDEQKIKCAKFQKQDIIIISLRDLEEATTNGIEEQQNSPYY